MNELIKVKLMQVLREEGESIIHSPEDIQARLSKMNDIFNIGKVIENYDELEPMLKEYFNNKAKEDKWKER